MRKYGNRLFQKNNYNFWRHRLTRINAHLSADDQLCGSLIRKSPFGAACLAPPSGHFQFYSAKGLVYLLIHQLAQKRIKRKVLTKVAVLLHTNGVENALAFCKPLGAEEPLQNIAQQRLFYQDFKTIGLQCSRLRVPGPLQWRRTYGSIFKVFKMQLHLDLQFVRFKSFLK